MKQQDLIAMAYDFLSCVFSKVHPSKIRQIILFGSVARDEFDDESDLDLFFDSPAKIENGVLNALHSFNATRIRAWNLRGTTIPIKPMIGNLEKPEWKDLRPELSDHGKILYSTHLGSKLPKENLLVNYTLESLPQSVKMKLLRRLFGYTIKKEGKTYPQQGVISKEDGERIGQNVFIIPIGSKKRIEAVLQEAKATYQLRKISY